MEDRTLYAKLIDEHRLAYAPHTITIPPTHYNPTPLWWLEENGYKPVVDTPMPDYEEGYYWDWRWEETDSEIIKVWEKKPIPPEPIAE